VAAPKLAGLEYLVRAYFHQDWSLDDPTPEAVLDRFASGESGETIRDARDGAAELLTRSDGQIAAQLAAWRTDYDPAADGRTEREWLETVEARLGSPPPPN
jgi:hypothetical protein